MDSNGNHERRRHTRHPFREDIVIDGTRMCTCSDISEGGLYVSAIQHFEEKGVIEVSIPFREDKITVKAQVQYCEPGIGMGIMFVELNDDQKALLKELIESISGQTA
jgi:hypothetical protein